MDELLTELGQRIRAARDIRGLTQEELAARAKLNNSFLSQLERGLKAPSLKTLDAIAKALEVPISQLFADGETMTSALVESEVAELLANTTAAQKRDLVELLRVGLKLTSH